MTLTEEDLLEKDFVELEGNTLKIKENLDVDESIKVDKDIDAENIDAWNIDAWNIDALNINARDIDAWSIDAWSIDAWSIDAVNIDAGNIDADNIDALNIDAQEVSYYAYCIACHSFTANSVEGRRDNSIHTCLEEDIDYKEGEESEKGIEDFSDEQVLNRAVKILKNFSTENSGEGDTG